jgi:hypothetical protein
MLFAFSFQQDTFVSWKVGQLLVDETEIG